MYQCHRPFCSGKILSFFYHIWVKRTSWFCNHHYPNKLSFPQPQKYTLHFGIIGFVVLGEMLFQTVDRRMTDERRQSLLFFKIPFKWAKMSTNLNNMPISPITDMYPYNHDRSPSSQSSASKNSLISNSHYNDKPFWNAGR